MWATLRPVLGVIMALAVAAAIGCAALAWLLAEHPLQIRWLALRIQAVANETFGPDAVTIRAAAIAWEGFHKGLGSPIVIRLDGIQVRPSAKTGAIEIPQAEFTLALGPLLHRRVEPRTVEIEAPQVALQRSADGRLGDVLGSRDASGYDQPRAALGSLALQSIEAGDGGESFRSLRHVRVVNAGLTIADRRLGVVWRVRRANLDLTRRSDGGVDGQAAFAVALDGAEASLTGSGSMTHDRIALHLGLAPVPVAAIAGVLPSLAPAAALEGKVSGEAELDLSPNLAVRQGTVALQTGAGTIRLGAGPVPISRVRLDASGTPDRIALNRLELTVQDHAGAVPTRLQASGILRRDARGARADLTIGLNRVALADLPALWPSGAADGARRWVTENITDGVAHDGHLELGLATDAALSRITLTSAKGAVAAEGVTVHWLRPVPPIEHGQATLRVLDPDTLEIAVAAGQESPEPLSDAADAGPLPRPLTIRSGLVGITGLTKEDQFLTIEGRITGTLPDALALLRARRLHLLSDHPVIFKDAMGEVDATLSLSLPLNEKLTMSDVGITAKATLAGVHLSDVAPRWDLDDGDLILTADADKMVANGTGTLASIPVQLDAMSDFRAGPPGQVLRRISVSAQADARALEGAAGLDANGLLSGPIPLRATYTEHRSGAAEVALHGDLTPATLDVAPLAWRKQPGVQAEAKANVDFDHGRIAAIHGIEVSGEGLAIRGEATFAKGELAAVQLSRIALGRSAAQATLHVTPGTGAIAVSVSGPQLDIAQRFAAAPRRSEPRVPGTRGPPWTLDARFDAVLLAHGEALSTASAHAESDGLVLREATLQGYVGKRAPARFEIRSGSSSAAHQGRSVSASAMDAGAVLRGLGVPGVIGGRLSLTGQYKDLQPETPLRGRVELDDFSIRQAPALGKLLQAVTVYGLLQALQGPGVKFSHLVAPFQFADDAIEVTDGRAFSPSLGITADGRVNLDADRIDLHGTLVPAYYLNTLLGRIPVLGRLFSPERGGGVIAANYGVHGPLRDPDVTVNPLAALTPGFLRGLFGRH